MYTLYTLQQHDPSGELYALRYNSWKRITGVCGPLARRDVPEIVLEDCEYNVEDAEWANGELWGYPLDPSKLEVSR